MAAQRVLKAMMMGSLGMAALWSYSSSASSLRAKAFALFDDEYLPGCTAEPVTSVDGGYGGCMLVGCKGKKNFDLLTFPTAESCVNFNERPAYAPASSSKPKTLLQSWKDYWRKTGGKRSFFSLAPFSPL